MKTFVAVLLLLGFVFREKQSETSQHASALGGSNIIGGYYVFCANQFEGDVMCDVYYIKYIAEYFFYVWQLRMEQQLERKCTK